MSVKRLSGIYGVRIAALSAALLAGGGLLAQGQAQTVAAADDWLTFDNSPSWSPGFDRSFAEESEQSLAIGFPTLSPNNVEYMRAAIKRYADIVERGGWRRIPEIELSIGKTHKAVAVLRERLRAEGDLTNDVGHPETFDSFVERAVKVAQIRHGLKPTGIVDKDTIRALNVPASAYVRMLRINLSRLKLLSAPLQGRYIVVNIPSAEVEAVENDQVVSRHAGVVGKQSRPTPILESKIHEINFNKEWILPPTVILEDLLPKARGNEGFKIFERLGVDVYANYNAYERNEKLDPQTVDWSSPRAKDMFFAQAPGRDNPLGFMKINFFNSHAVFMHDTPSQTLFSRNERAESSGCIRIQNISQLAAWLLRGNGDWDHARIASMKVTGETLNVPVKSEVKLYFAYLTAWATPDGAAHFRRDIYRRDGTGLTATVY
ncbi:MAG: murein L,D-transpeptidase [Rhodomicrobiaceae bacterium]